jgi:hypothetical protein
VLRLLHLGIFCLSQLFVGFARPPGSYRPAFPRLPGDSFPLAWKIASKTPLPSFSIGQSQDLSSAVFISRKLKEDHIIEIALNMKTYHQSIRFLFVFFSIRGTNTPRPTLGFILPADLFSWYAPAAAENPYFGLGFLQPHQAPPAATRTPTTAPRVCFQPMPVPLPIPNISAASETTSSTTPSTMPTIPMVLFDIYDSFEYAPPFRPLSICQFFSSMTSL